jgi:hypothetical protein
MEETRLKAFTPGGHTVRAVVLEKEYPVRQSIHGAEMRVPLFDQSGRTVLAKFITERIDKKRDCPILVTGDRGVGKSTIIAETALEINPDFPVEKVAFKLSDFERIFNENPYGDGSKGQYPQLSMDEAGYALYGPEWLKEEQRVIAKQLIISRIKQQIIWMAVPKRKHFNPHLRDMSYIWVHVTEPREYLQGYAIVRVAPPELQNEWFSEKYWVPRFVFTFPSLQGEWWDKYEKAKIEFVNTVTAETVNGQSKRSIPKEQVENLKRRGWTNQEIADHYHVHHRTIERINAEEFALT